MPKCPLHDLGAGPSKPRKKKSKTSPSKGHHGHPKTSASDDVDMLVPEPRKKVPITVLSDTKLREALIKVAGIKVPVIDLTMSDSKENTIEVFGKKSDFVGLPGKHIPAIDLTVPVGPPRLKKTLRSDKSAGSKEKGPKSVPSRLEAPKPTSPRPVVLSGTEAPKRPAEPPKPTAPGPIELPKPPSNLARIPLSVEKWKQLEYSSRLTMPRFLFRGFHNNSGGGIDPRLNSTNGIVPHGFLKKGRNPTTMYDSRNLIDMISGHLGGERTISSDFSSWASNFEIAAGYAGSHQSSYIAIINTTLLEIHVWAYHVPALIIAGLTAANYTQEYLVYGPIEGKAYHCVRYPELTRLRISRISDLGVGAGYAGFGYEDVDEELPPYMPVPDLERRVEVAKKLAALFRREDDERPDIIDVTVILTCAHLNRRKYGEELNKELMGELTKHLSGEMDAYRPPSLASGNPGLASPMTYTKEFPKLRQIVVLLKSFEEKVRSTKGLEALGPPSAASWLDLKKLLPWVNS